jgi:hypothetical protein
MDSGAKSCWPFEIRDGKPDDSALAETGWLQAGGFKFLISHQ